MKTRGIQELQEEELLTPEFRNVLAGQVSEKVAEWICGFSLFASGLQIRVCGRELICLPDSAFVSFTRILPSFNPAR
jgi:hypothetical protein